MMTPSEVATILGTESVVLVPVPSEFHAEPDESPIMVGVIDVETTGLNPDADSIIDIAIARCAINRGTGKIAAVKRALTSFNDPGVPLSPEITKLTGISDSDVREQRINVDAFNAEIALCDLIVAHNASFDRPFVEKALSAACERPWACSMSGIDWTSVGIVSTKLEFIAMKAGYTYRAHRAVADVYATMAVLDRFAEQSRGLIQQLAETYTVSAVGAPYATKEFLKARGYRWHDVDRVWSKELNGAQQVLDELKSLKARVYPGVNARPALKCINAYDRFSGRITREVSFDEIYDACGVQR